MNHTMLCFSALVVCAIVLLLPRIPQDPAYHVMADQRTVAGLPNAFDVLSNLPFAVVGGARIGHGDETQTGRPGSRGR